MTRTLKNGAAVFLFSDTQQKVSTRFEEKADLASAILHSHTLYTQLIQHLSSSKCDLRDESVLVCPELGRYSSVALEPEEDNANYLYLYLWSVCGKLLVNDSGSSKRTAYSAVASAVLSHTGALCP